MKKYYYILEIDETIDKKTIKRAYAKMVKKYRPEHEPVKFQEVRDAYDAIIDYLDRNTEENENKFNSAVDNSLENTYNSNFNLTVGVNDYIEKAKKYADEKLYDKAIDMYKRASLQVKENTKIINEIGVLYYYMGDIQNAIKTFDKAIGLDSTSHITYSNLAQLYIRNKQYELARLNYIKAYDIDKNLNYIKGILNTYKFSKDGEELFKALSEYNLNKEEFAQYYIECIKFAVEKCANFPNENNIEYLKYILGEIYNKFLNTDGAIDICDGIYKTASLLFDMKQYELSQLLVEYGIKIYKSPEIEHLENKISEHYLEKEMSNQVNNISYDRRIHPDIMNLVLEINNGSHQLVIDELLDNIEQINVKDFISDVEVIKLEYGLLYEKSKVILQSIEKDKKTKSQQIKLVYLLGLVLILAIILIFLISY